jgi:hypothetical protein
VTNQSDKPQLHVSMLSTLSDCGVRFQLAFL